MALVVAVSLVALLGFVALAVDAGALYAERAQLQNGADAAALAVAQDCADGSCTDPHETARQLVNVNANDGAATVGRLAFPTSGSVLVQATSRDAATGAGALTLTFASILGFRDVTVAAQAVAAWGNPAGGPAVLPLAFAPCVFKLDGPVQVISMHGDSGGTDCSSVSPSGKLLPGGFGWLDDPAGRCRADVDIAVNAPMRSDTGTSLPANCAPVLASVADQTVLLPVYGDKGGTGSGGWYAIRGWAAFQVLGWNFPGTSYRNTTYSGAQCRGSCKGLIGKFVRFVSPDEGFRTGGPDLGTSVVTLTR
ncbi:pilus assembly protein TadG-related protein [Arthrobacter sp. GCM10027362]|uniref:pilus assembly protein TadG-related protein n=1 Tax=Arthrobacter sp. GCM10027362 TaxID=3273379 RepID=UPI00362A3A0B